MHARPAKFLFSQEFGSAEPRRSSRAEPGDADLGALREQARTEGYAAGFAAARAAHEAEDAARVAVALAGLAEASARLLGTLDAERGAIEAEAVALALATARTLARGLVEREPVHEIARLAAGVLGTVRSAPHVVLRVAPDLVEAVETRAKRIAWERGFEGRLVVLGDPDRPDGDCRIEWADGGVVRDQAATGAAVEAAVQRYLAGRAAGATEQTP